jgi:glycosyltransferase involved in cell wall biosynthesis
MWQHMDSFARNLLQRGYPVRMLISPEYDWMNEAHRESTHYSLAAQGSFFRKLLSYLWFPWSDYRSLFLDEPPSGLLVVSWHPMNFLVLRLFKSLYPEAPTCVWLHEPFKDEKRIYGAKAIVIYLVEWCQTLSLRYMDVVIVHSRRALRLFEKRYPRFRGDKRLIPLPFEDDKTPAASHRPYISFLGRADRAKGIELFFALVEGFTQNGPNGEFQIVTSSDIAPFLAKLSAEARKRLRVVSRPKITDGDLRQAAGASLAVLALYKETMQSGVIPVAWMKGTPVIGTDIEGITEWVRDRETGVIVSANPSREEIAQAVEFIQSHLPEMTQRCRAEYVDRFDDSNWDHQYGWLKAMMSGGARGASLS